MKRLIAKDNNLQIGDYVYLKNSPNDKLAYEIIDIADDGNLLIKNETGGYVGVNPNTVEKIR